MKIKSHLPKLFCSRFMGLGGRQPRNKESKNRGHEPGTTNKQTATPLSPPFTLRPP